MDFIKSQDLQYFNGVPDSFLKELLSVNHKNIKVSPNEGSAIAHATGYYLATTKTPIVYMQNSGLGNAINPLTSMTSLGIFNIPLLLFIGWRGEEGINDEPQHIIMGKNTPAILKACDIEYEFLSTDFVEAKKQIIKINKSLKISPRPFALVIKKDSFKAQKAALKPNHHKIIRYEFLKQLISKLNNNHLLICTTGHTSREVYKIREELKQDHSSDFYCIGAMGHVSQIALAIAENSTKEIICLDGDGSLLMHLGNIISARNSHSKNFNYLVFNNEGHLSVGGQRTAWGQIEIQNILGEAPSQLVEIDKIEETIKTILTPDKNCLIEVMVKNLVEKDLPRPKESPEQLKIKFMENFNE